MQDDVINTFLKEKLGSQLELTDGVCHIQCNGEYFGTLAYQEPLIRITFIYKLDFETIPHDMAMSLLLLNAHPEMLGRGAFSVTDHGVVLLTFHTQSQFFTVPELTKFWEQCLAWRMGYFKFLDDTYKKSSSDKG